MAKVVIGAIGTGNYTRTVYEVAPDYTTFYCIVSLTKAIRPDKVVILLTEEAKQKHWETVAAELREIPGVELIVQPIQVGANADQLWKNFDAMAGCIQKGDIVSFDVTNAFRSLSVVFASAITYVCEAKDVTLEGIYYGALEASSGGITPVFRLDAFSSLMALADAVAAFRRSGDIALLAAHLADIPSLGKDAEELAALFGQLALALDIGRPLEFMACVARLTQHLESLDAQTDVPAPFRDLFAGIAAEFAPFAFSEEQVKCDIAGSLQRMLRLIEWCFAKRRIALTALLAAEYIISLTLWQQSKEQEIYEYKARDQCRKALNKKNDSVRISREVCALWKKTSDLRNDLAHVGMHADQRRATAAIITQLKEIVDDIKQLRITL